LLLTALPAVAQDSGQALDVQIASCASYAACMRLLDANVRFTEHYPKRFEDGSAVVDAGEQGVLDQARRFAARLESFGEDGKQELLKRARDPDALRTPDGSARAESAEYILRNWDRWSDDDIPVLGRIVSDNGESQLTWVLAKIGTPRAIRALMGIGFVPDEFVTPNPNAFQPLRSLGSKALPYLLDGLNAKFWSNTQLVISGMGQAAIDAAPSWLATASDPQQPLPARIAALRALGGLATKVADLYDGIAALRRDPEVEVRRETFHALREMGDAGSAGELVEFCPALPNALTTRRFDPNRPWLGSHPFSWDNCVKEIAWLGDEALPYGEQISGKFLYSVNGTDRADGATVVGYIGYKPATARLIELLDDPDWHVAYASARALRWLQASEAIPALQRVTEQYWLPDIRAFDGRVIATLRAPDNGVIKPDRGERKDPFHNKTEGETFFSDKFTVQATVLPTAPACKSERWRWRNVTFTWPKQAPRTVPRRFQRLGYPSVASGFATVSIRPEGKLPAGDIVGADIGEFGGKLSWVPVNGKEETLYDTNTSSLLPASSGAIATFSEGVGGTIPEGDDTARVIQLPNGEVLQENDLISNYPTGYGFAVHVTRDSSGGWHLKEAARFIQGGAVTRNIARDLYVAWSGNRVIVFDTNRILGLADCGAAK
jgi:hypothetical protein